MGMAASQARFLQLTARKNNDEYMGQQINQSRTALANKSAGLFEKMLALQPPTPPSSMDDKYYTQGYGFTDPRDGIRKKIVWSEMSAAPSTAQTSVTVPAYYSNATGTRVTGLTLNAGFATDLANLPTSAISGLLNPVPEGTASTIVRYATFEHTAYDPEGNYHVYKEQKPIVAYFDSEERLLNFQDLTINVSGYVSDPSSPDYYNPGDATHAASHGNPAVADGSAPTLDNLVFSAAASASPIDMAYQNLQDGTGYSNKDLTYNGNFDEVQFQQDMDRYEFEKNAYDYQIERINLETKQIQQQDKSMELKLKQIDTDHQAIQTEMEAVSKVITKNIESTFKTFA